MPPLTLQSSARVHSPHARILIFGDPEVGKTMTVPTAPNPVWLLTEPTRVESLTRENIEKVYGPPPGKEAILAWLKKEDAALKGKALDEAVAQLMEDPSPLGITYDVPRIDVSDYEKLSQTVDWLKSEDAKDFDTVFLDSATMASELVLNFHLNKKTAAGKQMDGRLAHKRAGDETYTFFENLTRIPKHIVCICHGHNFMDNLGTEEAPVWNEESNFVFKIKKLRTDAHFLFSNIFRVIKGRKGPDGKMLLIDDKGRSIRTLKTRADTRLGVERTLCPRIADQEDTNLTALFAKLTAK